MRFSLLDPATKESIVLPVAPSSMRVTIGTKTLSFDPITLGTVELPRGRMPIQFDLSGLLPGLNQSVPERESELSPEEIVSKIKTWSDTKGANGKKVRFIVTDTDWNLTTYIDKIDAEYSGGAGDIIYNLSVVEWRDFVVKETKAQKPGKAAARPAKPKPTEYTIKRGDTLWAIAKRYTGSGSKWPELWSGFKSKSRSKNPDLIYPGEKVPIPPGWKS